MTMKRVLSAEDVLNKFHLDVVERLARESRIDRESEVSEVNYYEYLEAHLVDIASGSWGWRMFEPLMDFFGIESDKQLDITDYDELEEVNYMIENCMDEVAHLMTKHFSDKLNGFFSFGYHESDGSFCLFYIEQQEIKATV